MPASDCTLGTDRAPADSVVEVPSKTLPAMLPSVYEELRRVARFLMRRERAGHTLQPTDVVDMAYLRVAGIDLEIHDKAHCFRLLARNIRRVLVDHAKSRRRLKRDLPTMAEVATLSGEGRSDIEMLDAITLIDKFSAHDPRAAEMVTLRYFFGVDDHELAALFQSSTASIERKMKFAKAWFMMNCDSDAPTHGLQEIPEQTATKKQCKCDPDLWAGRLQNEICSNFTRDDIQRCINCDHVKACHD